MSDDLKKTRKPGSPATPTGLSTIEERGRPGHREHSTRSSQAMRPMPREQMSEYDPAAPDEEMDEFADSKPVPAGATPFEEMKHIVARAHSKSREAKEDVERVRTEMRAEITAMNTKFDAIAAAVSAASGEMRTVSGVLNRQLEAAQEQQKLVLAAMLGAQSATTAAKIDEAKASGAHKRSLSEKVVIALIGLVLAVQTYFFASK